jgi:hypothetical protein
MEFKIERTEVYGLNKSIIASGNAMRTEMNDNTLEKSDKDLKRAINLGTTKCGEGHDNFLNGIIVQFDLYAPLYMWKQLQRYHFLDFISSQSTMHRLAKFNIKEQCVEDTDEVILNRYQELLDDYNNNKGMTISVDEDKKKWRTLVASLPCGFVLGATMTTNYRQLKTIYNQRKHHKLKEWHEFCSWCETLPYFKELCLGEKQNG